VFTAVKKNVCSSTVANPRGLHLESADSTPVTSGRETRVRGHWVAKNIFLEFHGQATLFLQRFHRRSPDISAVFLGETFGGFRTLRFKRNLRLSIVRFFKVAFRAAKVRTDATLAERKATLIFRTMLKSARR